MTRQVVIAVDRYHQYQISVQRLTWFGWWGCCYYRRYSYHDASRLARALGRGLKCKIIEK